MHRGQFEPGHKTILDVGCGMGQTLFAANLQHDVQAFGVDIDEEAIEATLSNFSIVAGQLPPRIAGRSGRRLERGWNRLAGTDAASIVAAVLRVHGETRIGLPHPGSVLPDCQNSFSQVIEAKNGNPGAVQ